MLPVLGAIVTTLLLIFYIYWICGWAYIGATGKVYTNWVYWTIWACAAGFGVLLSWAWWEAVGTHTIN